MAERVRVAGSVSIYALTEITTRAYRSSGTVCDPGISGPVAPLSGRFSEALWRSRNAGGQFSYHRDKRENSFTPPVGSEIHIILTRLN